MLGTYVGGGLRFGCGICDLVVGSEVWKMPDADDVAHASVNMCLHEYNRMQATEKKAVWESNGWKQQAAKTLYDKYGRWRHRPQTRNMYFTVTEYIGVHILHACKRLHKSDNVIPSSVLPLFPPGSYFAIDSLRTCATISLKRLSTYVALLQLARTGQRLIQCLVNPLAARKRGCVCGV